ncbi:MAG: acyl-CoA dehydrogenase family protein [Myxococcota bacterium]
MSMDDPRGAEPEPHAAFRRELRGWLDAHLPGDPGFKLPQSFLEVESDAQLGFLRDWQRKLYEHGWLGFDVPEEYGGRGVDPDRARIVTQELARARAPFLVNRIGLQWAGPVILQFGTEAQKRKHLPGILSSDDIWCQGFSEPEAGSDLASLGTRAVRADDGWRITGHKVWTTLAHAASYMILLARTDPDKPKYLGLSYFLFPMQTRGVTVEPLVKMTGEGGFNQVFLDDAPCPADAILGEEGQGWNVAIATLLFERGASGGGMEGVAAVRESFALVVDLARRVERDGRPAIEDAVIRDRLTQLWIEIEALALAPRRAQVEGLAGDRPMALPMMNKLVSSEINQRLTELACELLGPEATLWLGDPNAPDGARWPRAYMNSFGMTIGGGTSEILRNILGERVLGLPKSK